jgi:putative ABC transport system substrate-binding protein
MSAQNPKAFNEAVLRFRSKYLNSRKLPRWELGRNLKIEIRQIGGDIDRIRRFAAEIVALEPDAILAVGSIAVGALQQETHSIPIVFVNAPDPVGAGFVENMSHPGGNITGFSNFEYSMSGKWAELLK